MKSIKPDTLNSKSEILFQKTLRYLSFRSRSWSEIHAYLKRQLPTPTAQEHEAVIQHLQVNKLVDDTTFAAELSQHLLAKGKGPVAIKQALIHKGLKPPLISSTLEGLERSSAYHPHLKKVALKKLRHLSAPSYFIKQAKLSQFLFSRGYSNQQIRWVIDEIAGNQ